MSKLTRATFKFWGSNSGFQQIEQFGSLAGGTPVYTTNVSTIQALSAWLEGWFGAVVGSNFPAIEDMNAVLYVYAYMLAEMFQDGVPPWDSGTTYYKGSLVQDGNGVLYISLQDSNTNNVLSNNSWWVITGSADVVTVNPFVTPTYALGAPDLGKTFLVESSLGAITFTLPTPSLNFRILIKDTGDAGTNNITINPHASETIDGQGTLVIALGYGWVELSSDGTNWYITNGQIASGAGLLPTGTPIPTFSTTADPGFLMCFGQSVLRSQYPALFAKIGTSCGSVDSTHFNVPQLQGVFLRGTDNGFGNDPDAASRTAMATGGNSGDNPGSVQGWQIQSHVHSKAILAAGGTGGFPAWADAATPTGSANTNATGGNQTNPINAGCNFQIKT